MYARTNVHMQDAKQILCYLEKNLGKGILITKQDEFSFEGYNDVDWVGSTDTRNSTIGSDKYMCDSGVDSNP